MRKPISFLIILSLCLSLVLPQLLWAQAPQGPNPQAQQQGPQNPYQLNPRDTDAYALLKQITEALASYRVGKKFGTMGVLTLGPVIDRGVALSLYGIAKVVDWVRANELRSPSALAIYVLFLRANQQELSSQLSYIRDQLVGRISMPPEFKKDENNHLVKDESGNIIVEKPAQIDAPGLETLKADLTKKITAYNEFLKRLCPEKDVETCAVSLEDKDGSRIMASKVTVGLLQNKVNQIERLLRLRMKATQVLLLDLGLVLAQSNRQLNNAINRQHKEMAKILNDKKRSENLGLSPEEIRQSRIDMMEKDLSTLRAEKMARDESQAFFKTEAQRLLLENKKLAERVGQLSSTLQTKP